MEPAGAIPINILSDEYTKTQFQVQSNGQSSAFCLEQLYTLRTPRHAEQFNRACNDQKAMSLYLDVIQYAAQNKLSLESLFTSGFENLEIFDGLTLDSNLQQQLNFLRTVQTKQPNQLQQQIILECQVALGVPMIAEQVANVDLSRQNLPIAYDCYAIVPKDVCQIKNATLQPSTDQLLVSYKLFQKERILPTRLLVVNFKLDTQDAQQECQVCKHCVQNKISKLQYFGKADVAQPLQTVGKAEVFCENDQLALCAECDRFLHVGLLQAHRRVAVQLQSRLDSCKVHGEELRFIDQKSKRFYCQKCLGTQKIQVENVSDVYFGIQKDFAEQINLVDLKGEALKQVENLNQSLQRVQQMSTSCEQVLIGYFKQMVKQLQLVTQTLTQQILGQDVEILKQVKLADQMQQLMVKAQQEMSTNQFVQSFGIFKQQAQQLNLQLNFSQDCTAQFMVGIQKQIEQMEQSFKQMPQQHLSAITQLLDGFMAQRLYGVFGRSARSEPFYLRAGEQNQLVFKQLQQQKLQANFSQIQQEEFTQQETLKLFNQLNTNDQLLQFADQTPAYKAVQQRSQQMREKKQEEERQRQLEAQLEAEQQEQEELKSRLQQTQVQQSQFGGAGQKQILTAVQREEMFNSLVSTQKMKSPQKRLKTEFLDQIFNDKEGPKVVQGVQGRELDRQLSMNSFQPTQQLFDASMRSLKRNADSRWSGLEKSLDAQKNLDQLFRQDVAGQQKPEDPKQADQKKTVDFENLNQSLERKLDQIPEISQLKLEKKQIPGDLLFTQEPDLLQKPTLQLQTQFDKLCQLYKIKEKGVQLPVQTLQEAELQQKDAEQVLVYYLHALSKARGFAKLKLLEPVLKLDRKFGNKFQSVLQACEHLSIMTLMQLFCQQEKKCVAVCVFEQFGEKVFEGKWNGFIDIGKGEIVECGMEISKKFWKCGELYVYKDFANVEFEDKIWNVDSVDVFTFEWQ